MPRAKGLFHKSIAPMHELKIREKDFPRCEPHCTTTARHLDVPECTYTVILMTKSISISMPWACGSFSKGCCNPESVKNLAANN